MIGNHYRWRMLTIFVVLSVSLLLARFSFGLGKQHLSNVPKQGNSLALLHSYGKVPLVFEANSGQTDKSVKFLAHGTGYTLFLTALGPLLAFSDNKSQSMLHLHLVGANPHPQIRGLDKLPGTTNYFVGSDPRSWHTNIPTYGKVMYQDVYPGVNLSYYGNQSHLEYDFLLAPGVSPASIRLSVAGEQSLAIDARGNIVLRIASGEVLQPKPFIYQEIAGSKQSVPGRYVLLGANQIGFEVGTYDTTRPLVIDPVLTYSTYLGGSGNDQAYGIALDGAGNTYITGYTDSQNFPIKNALQPTNHGANAFIAKLNANGQTLVYSTYLGGSDYEYANGIAVDSAGSVYTTGDTGSGDFPTKHAFQKTDLHPGFGTGFISKLKAKGSTLVFSTFLGGSGLDIPQAIAVDSANNVYVTGWTQSKDFPTKNALQPTKHGPENAFVSELNAGGNALIYSTYLGGHGHDLSNGIAVDSKGDVYLTGYTDSADFPVVNAIQPQKVAFADVFISELKTNGSTLLFSTYLGGSEYDDQGNSIAIDSAGTIYVTGYTQSKKFPTKNAFQAQFGGGSYDAFVTKIGP